MGKNSKKLRRQEYPSQEEIDEEWERENRANYDEPAAQMAPSIRPPRQTYRAAKDNRHREGDLVTFKTSLSGTVVQVMGDTLMILEGNGLLHEVKHYDAYTTQAPC